MADELGFDFTPTGEDALSNALAQVQAKLSEQLATVNSLTAKVNEHSASVGGLTAKLGAEAAAVQRVTPALQAHARSLDGTATAAAQVGAATGAANPAIASFRQGLSSLGPALGALSPELARTTGIIGGLTQAVGSSTSSMGPWGIAIGAAVGVIGTIASELASAKREAEQFTQSLLSSTQSISAFVQARQQENAQRARDRLLAEGGGTPEESELAAQGLRRRAEGLRRQANDQFSALNVFRSDLERTTRWRELTLQAEAAERQASALEQRVDRGAVVIEESGAPLTGIAAIRARAEAGGALSEGDRIALDKSDDMPIGAGAFQALRARERASRRGGGNRGPTRADMDREVVRKRNDSDSITQQLAQEAAAQQAEADRTRLAKIREADELQLQMQQERIDAEERAEQKRIDSFNRMRDEELDRQRQRNDIYLGMWTATSSAALDTIRSFTEGDETATKKRLKQRGIEEGWAAASALAVAVGNVIFNPPGAASKFAEAAQHAAIAAALGGTSALLGGGSRSASNAGGDRARPDRIGGDSVRRDGSIVVNVNAPAVITEGGRGELAATIGSHLRDWQWRTGEAA